MRIAILIVALLAATAVAQQKADAPAAKVAAPEPETSTKDESGTVSTKATPAEPATGRPNPFTASDIVRDRMAAAEAAPAVTPHTPAAPRPRLAGVITRGDTVLACFHVGDLVVVVARGDILPGRVDYEFVSYADGLATLRDPEGTPIKIRMGTTATTVTSRPTTRLVIAPPPDIE